MCQARTLRLGPGLDTHGSASPVLLLLAGLQAFVEEAYAGYKDVYPYGLFYGGGGQLLASQCVGILAIIAWVVGLMIPFYYAFKVRQAGRRTPGHATPRRSAPHASKHARRRRAKASCLPLVGPMLLC